MKLLAPVSSLDSAILQIQSGAEELYLSSDDGIFRGISFSGRGKYNPKGEKIAPDFAELKAIVEYAHEHDVTVMYTANLPFLADDANGAGQTHIKYFLDYVEQGIKAGVDSVVVGDVGGVLLLRERGIKTHLTASVFMETVNKEQVLFLRDLGVDRVVLSYQMTMDEIEDIASQEGMGELEVFGHFGCSFFDGYCNMKHSFGESEEMGIGIPCQSNYQLCQGGEVKYTGPVLNATLACSICSLPRLMKAKIYALKMVGRERNMEQNALITSIYRQGMDRIREVGIEAAEKDGFMNSLRQEILPRWWQQGLCRIGKCKYKKNAVTRSFIGLPTEK